jgi:hypothetical protein
MFVTRVLSNRRWMDQGSPRAVYNRRAVIGTWSQQRVTHLSASGALTTQSLPESIVYLSVEIPQESHKHKYIMIGWTSDSAVYLQKIKYDNISGFGYQRYQLHTEKTFRVKSRQTSVHGFAGVQSCVLVQSGAFSLAPPAHILHLRFSGTRAIFYCVFCVCWAVPRL